MSTQPCVPRGRRSTRGHGRGHGPPAGSGCCAGGLAGQVCLAQTRALVQRDVVDEFLGMAEMIGGMVSYGSPFDPAVTSAPLINTRQLDRVLGLIADGRESGARLVCGGTRGEGDLPRATSSRRRCSPT